MRLKCNTRNGSEAVIDSFNLGVASEFIVAGFLMEMGYEVFLPFDRRSKQDLLCIKDNKIQRIQVKRAGWSKSKSNEYLRVSCASHGVKYSKVDIDLLAVLDPSHRMWLIPIEEISEKQVLILDKIIRTRGFIKALSKDYSCWRVK